MRRSIAYYLGIGFAGLAYAEGDPPRIENIEIHTAYAAPIEGHTKYLTQEGSTTKWKIGVNTEYLTELTHTTTVDSKETTVVVPVQIEVTEAEGDTVVMLADTVQDDLNAVIQGAADACRGPAKLRKRAGVCWLENVAGAAENGEVVPLINPAEWEAVALKVANNAPAIITHYANMLAAGAIRNKFYLMVGAGLTAGLALNDKVPEAVKEVPHKFKFDNGEIAKPKKDGDSQTTATKTTASACPQATANEHSPACDDKDCEGKKQKCTKDGDKKGCPCVMWAANEFMDDHWDQEWRDFQQKYLGELLDAVPDVLPPSCFRNTHGDDFDGKPKADPSAFCHCSSLGPDGMIRANFPTMTGEGDAACTYTTMPDLKKTISISTAPKPTKHPDVTSCRVESLRDGKDHYCTCNDNAMHKPTTTTLDGKKTTVCPDHEATGSPDGSKKVKIILEYQSSGADYDLMNWLFFSVGGDEDVRCNANIDPSVVVPAKGAVKHAPQRQQPAGTYKVKTKGGDCEYKNNGEGNPGMLRCGDQRISCSYDHASENEGFKDCSSIQEVIDQRIKEGGKGILEHTEVITCA